LPVLRQNFLEKLGKLNEIRGKVQQALGEEFFRHYDMFKEGVKTLKAMDPAFKDDLCRIMVVGQFSPLYLEKRAGVLTSDIFTFSFFLSSFFLLSSAFFCFFFIFFFIIIFFIFLFLLFSSSSFFFSSFFFSFPFSLSSSSSSFSLSFSFFLR